MQLYSVAIERKRVERVRVAAPDAFKARASAERLLRAGDRIAEVIETAAADENHGREALDHLLGREYLDLNGRPMLVEDWLRAALAGAADDLNPRLSVAGLRVAAEGRICIGSPSSIPTLHGWFVGTRWDGSGLITALTGIPGAGRAACTMAGYRTRCALLAAATVFPEDCP